MGEGPVVSNTTPLINLAGVGLLHLLKQLYGDVWIPEQVRDEYAAGARTSDPQLDRLPWIVVKAVTAELVWPENDSHHSSEGAATRLACRVNASRQAATTNPTSRNTAHGRR